jgi:glycosyltransferase involved in cell wall biosynthesis
MKICLISTEIFAWGKYGGFGRATRTIGRELFRHGVDVSAVVPRRRGQPEVADLDGIRVRGFSPLSPWSAVRALRSADADIYHSCEVSLPSVLALQAMPDRRHMVTFRDPRDADDWRSELAFPSLNRGQVLLNWLYEGNPAYRPFLRRMDAHYVIGRDLMPKVRRTYRVSPRFLPTPVAVPPFVRKASTPTVCYVARLDRRKRPEMFLDLAARFPHVRFVAAGRSRDRGFEERLRDKYAGIPNLEMPGFLDQFDGNGHSELLERSWILVNAAPRETMPNSILEASAHGCAILACVDPDGFASCFGHHAPEGDLATGLKRLLADRRWEEAGLRGRDYVRTTFDTPVAIRRHLRAYAELLGRRPLRRAA